MVSIPPRECTLSIKLLWPFVRVLGSDVESARLANKHGIHAEQFTDPDARVPHRAVMEMLSDRVTRTGDPTIGLRAAEVVEPGDVDVAVYAARSCATLGEAFLCMARYFHIMNEAAEVTLNVEGGRAFVAYDVIDGVPQPAASTDFVMAALFRFAHRNAKLDPSDIEVWFAHPPTSYGEAYGRVLGSSKVRFGAPMNALVLPAERVGAPMLRADPIAARAFRLRADQLLEKLKENEGVAGRVRVLVSTHLASGTVTMTWAARMVGMSVPTLRRHLEAQGTTFSEVVDGVRRQLAERHLRESVKSISELAFLLGFSNVAAFHRAFKRYTGVSPAEFRAQVRGR